MSKMKAKQDQRNEIQFCQRAGMSKAETIQQMRHVHGNQVLSDSSIWQWFNFFQTGQNRIEDVPHPGQLKNVLLPKSSN